MQQTVQRPFVEQGWIRAIIFFAVYIGFTVLAGTAVAAAFASRATKGNTVTPTSILLAYICIAAIAGIGLAVVFRLFFDKKPVKSLGISRQVQWNEIALGLLLGLVLTGTGTLILHLNGNLRWTDAVFSGRDFFILLIAMLVLAASEEIAFRGYMLNNLLESFDKKAALAVSALLFTAAHLFNPGINGIAVINLLLGGLLLGINFVYTRTLWFAIAFHFSWNFFQGPVFGFAVSGLGEYSVLQQELNGNPLLTGQQFGLEGSIIATTVMVLAMGLLYFVYENRKATP